MSVDCVARKACLPNVEPEGAPTDAENIIKFKPFSASFLDWLAPHSPTSIAIAISFIKISSDKHRRLAT
uniref:Uncharacterized protein n=1 Tax=Physcomitrium patens TaxID=3218 RepID=A0A2K1KD62_PHYPA|nr:hypothetical protein PHYPA_010904 [Physcomitrium patens]